jgi:hypothetical protein
MLVLQGLQPGSLNMTSDANTKYGPTYLWLISMRNPVCGTDSDESLKFRQFSVKPITAAAQSKAWTVFACPNAGIMVSNSTRGMDVVCVFSVFVMTCVQVAVLRRAYPPSKEYYRLCIGLRSWKRPRPNKGLYNHIYIYSFLQRTERLSFWNTVSRTPLHCAEQGRVYM